MAILSAAVIAEGAYIVKTRRQIEALSQEVRELAAERDLDVDGERPAGWNRPEGRAGGGGERGAGPAAVAAPRLPPPRFVDPDPGAPPAPTPLPVVLESPEAREQLRQFIAAELERERQERRDRELERRQQEEQRRTQAFVEAVAKQLNLTTDESRRFGDLVAKNQQARRDLRQKIESGQIQRQDLGREFQALRDQGREQMRQLLGEERLKKVLEMERQQGRGGPGGPGGRPWRGGGPGGGDPNAPRPAGGTPPG